MSGLTVPALINGDSFSCLATDMAASATGAATDQAFHQVEQIRERRSNADEFREAAIALDEEFMRSVRKKQEVEKRERPGIKESKARWQRHVKLVHKQLNELRNAEEGSLQWAYRESLKESLEDAPR